MKAKLLLLIFSLLALMSNCGVTEPEKTVYYYMICGGDTLSGYIYGNAALIEQELAKLREQCLEVKYEQAKEF